MAELWESVQQLFTALGNVLAGPAAFLYSWLWVVAWLAWWLWAVNWHKAWSVLAHGAWAPLVLLMLVVAAVWSAVSPGGCDCLGFPLPNYWAQLFGLSLLVAATLFCGWLQGVFGWTPPEMDLEPPAATTHAHH